jgi:phenylacetate-CoA ligase
MRRDLASVRAKLEAHRDPQRRQADQLLALNAVWQDAIRHVPHYRDLVDRQAVPDRFGSLAEFTEAVAPVSRDRLRSNMVSFQDPRRRTSGARVTGGSSGEPLRIPSQHGESTDPALAMWAARAAFGVTPASRMLLVWGHAHLLGGGVAGQLRGLRRRAADLALGYRRISTYDLSVLGHSAALEVACGSGFDVVMGYASALDAIARSSRARQIAPGPSRLRAVIATAEALPHNDSRSVIEAAFGAPLVLEYGAAETGVIAYSGPETGDDLQVLSTHHVVEVLRPTDGMPLGEVLVTSLFPRAVPLFRYRLGDRAHYRDEAASDGATVGWLRGLVGRASGLIPLRGEGSVHSELFAHVVRDEPAVLRYQVEVRPTGPALLLVVDTTSTADPGLRDRIAQRLQRANEALSATPIEFVDRPQVTPAGKTPIVIDRRDA